MNGTVVYVCFSDLPRPLSTVMLCISWMRVAVLLLFTLLYATHCMNVPFLLVDVCYQQFAIMSGILQASLCLYLSATYKSPSRRSVGHWFRVGCVLH